MLVESSAIVRTPSLVGPSVLCFIIVGIPTAYLLWAIQIARPENMSKELPTIGAMVFFAFLVGSFTAALSGLIFGIIALLISKGAKTRSLLVGYWIGTGLTLGAISGLAGLWLSFGWFVPVSTSTALSFGVLPGALSGAACLAWQMRSWRRRIPRPGANIREL